MSTFLFFLPLLLTFTVFAVYLERKIAAFIQDRLGPMEVGPYGLLQTVADLLKLLQKEDIINDKADKKLFVLGPILIFVAIFSGFSVLPLTSEWTGSSTEVGIFFMLAIISLDVLGVLMAGWGSNSKYSLLGAMRAVAQIISYEVPLVLSILCVLVISQTLDLQEIAYQQSVFVQEVLPEYKNYLFGLSQLGVDVTNIGGVLTWNIVRFPLSIFAFIVFFICILAESNRAPFDLPEAESELIGGFHTEYSGFRWAFLMLSEYGMMLLLSILGAVLFFGAWNSPFPNLGTFKLAEWTSGSPGTFLAIVLGIFWLLTKAFLIIFLQMWVRWAFPRLRVDQLMSLAWKYLTPFSLILLFIASVWRIWMV